MMRTTTVLSGGQRNSTSRRAMWLMLAVAVVAAATPVRAEAQFGAFKKLKKAKDAVSAPDTAARAKDSVAKAQNISNGEVVTDSTKKSGSLFSRAKSAAEGASEKFEAVTGVSAKDAALAATGAGIAGIAAKKLGVDPTSIVNNAVSKAAASAQQKATAAATGAIPGMPSGDAASALQSMQGLQAQAAQAQAMATMQGKALSGLTAGSSQAAAMAGAMPHAQLMLEFQQSMMKVSMEATAGSPSARAKLDAWQKLSEKYERQGTKLSQAIAGGDMSAYVKLQELQTGMMREWLKAYGEAPAKPTGKP